MRGPNSLEAMPFEIVQLMAQLQDWAVTDIARRISSSGVITSSAEYQLTRLREMQNFDEDLKKVVQKKLKASDEQLKKLYEDAAKANYIYDKRLFDKKGIPFAQFEQNAFMQNLTQNIIRQTQSEMANITRSLGFAEVVDGKTQFKYIAQFYQDTLDFANMQITTGVSDINTVLKGAVDKMANSGLRTVDYASGWSNRVEVATRRAVMGGMRDLTNAQSEYNAGILGTTCFEISWHSGHRPSHGWGGRRYDAIGEHYPRPEDLYKEHGGGTPQDYNCYHEIYAVDPDTPSNYSDDELDKMEKDELKTKTYDGIKYTKYEAKQYQRKIESAMRTTRLKAKGYQAAELKEEYSAAMGRYQQQRRLYGSFSRKMGLQTEYDRVYVDGLGKLDQYPFTLSAKDGIINTRDLKKISQSIKDIGGLDRVELDGVNVDIAAGIESEYKKVFTRYPEMKNNFFGIDAKGKGKNTYASCWPREGLVSVNKKYFGMPVNEITSTYNRDVKSGWHPEGTNWKGILSHELGHAADAFLTKNALGKRWQFSHCDNISDTIREKALKELNLLKKDIAKELSGYATKNSTEFFAEAFCEYINSPNPRRLAQKVGELIDEYMKGVGKP